MKNPASLTEATTPSRRVATGARPAAAVTTSRSRSAAATPSSARSPRIASSPPHCVQSQQADRIPPEDLLFLLWRRLHLLDRAQCLPNVARPPLGIERHVTPEQHVGRTEEGESALQGGGRSVQRRICIKHSIVVVRVLLERTQQGVILVRGPSAE